MVDEALTLRRLQSCSLIKYVKPALSLTKHRSAVQKTALNGKSFRVNRQARCFHQYNSPTS